MADELNDDRLQAFNDIVSLLSRFDEETQEHILVSVCNWLGLSIVGVHAAGNGNRARTVDTDQRAFPGFAEQSDISPKDFLLEKAPQTHVERVACLAYYLTHYRNTPHFKTPDISKLNTEAAQPKFTNPTVALDNATKAGLLVTSTKGKKQISAMGEQFVIALPDHEKAKVILKKMRPRRRRARASKKKTTNK